MIPCMISPCGKALMDWGALHAQVQAAGFLRQHFAQRTEQQRRAVGDGGHHQCDEQIHGIQHDASSLLSV